MIKKIEHKKVCVVLIQTNNKAVLFDEICIVDKCNCIVWKDTKA